MGRRCAPEMMAAKNVISGLYSQTGAAGPYPVWASYA